MQFRALELIILLGIPQSILQSAILLCMDYTNSDKVRELSFCFAWTNKLGQVLQSRAVHLCDECRPIRMGTHVY